MTTIKVGTRVRLKKAAYSITARITANAVDDMRKVGGKVGKVVAASGSTYAVQTRTQAWWYPREAFTIIKGRK